MATLGARNRSKTYIVQTNHGYYFRIRVPEDIQPYLGKKELRYALKVDYFLEAKSMAAKLGEEAKQMFKKVRRQLFMGKYSNGELMNVVNRYWKDFSNMLEEFRIRGEQEIYGAMGAARGVMDFIPNPSEQLACGDYNKIGMLVDRLIESNALEIKSGTSDYNMLCREMLKAKAKFDKLEMARAHGNYDDDIEHIFKVIETETNVIHEDGPAKPKLITPTLEKVAEDFWDWGVNSEGWKPRSQVDYKKCLEIMLDFLDRDRMIHEITDKDIVAYREYILKKEVGAKRNQFYMGRANMFFKYAIEEKRLLPKGHENPVAGLVPKIKKKDRVQTRKSFDADDLKKLFHSKEYLNDTHKEPYQFWLPILALYTGARIEELCQLYVIDIKRVAGVWCLDINEDKPDKSVKNGEQRLVPLHPIITDKLGFVAFVSKTKDRGGRVFNLNRVNNRYGHYPSKWFSKWSRKSCDIDPTPNVKVFHSFRRTMISHLMIKSVPKYQIKMLVGHSNDDDITIGTYGETLQPDVLMDSVIMKLDYGLDFAPLAGGKFSSPAD